MKIDLAQIRDGNRLAIARLLTQVENDTPAGREALDGLFPFTGNAHVVGITGAPGVGKSSLVNQLAYACRHPENGLGIRSVAIVAVDPTSPFTGGAILGDRVRMRDLSGDAGVFIRSMATRGELGGLARTTAEVVQVLDAAGFDIIFIETVGAGQSEVDIAQLAHTTVVVEAPGMGDDIQAIKAGILEIADVLVINKADLPGIDQTERALRSMLEMAHPEKRVASMKQGHAWQMETLPELETTGVEPWLPPVLRAVALQREGIGEIIEAIDAHRKYLEQSGSFSEREWVRIRTGFERLVQQTLVERWRGQLNLKEVRQVMHQLRERKISPFQALAILVPNYETDGIEHDPEYG